MATTEELLKQILSAQLAQIALLQAIATGIGAQVGAEHGNQMKGNVDLNDAMKAFEAAGFQLSQR